MNNLINEDDKMDYQLSREEINYLESIGFSGWDASQKYGMSYIFNNSDKIVVYKTQGKYILIYYIDSDIVKTRKIFDSFKEMINFMEN